MSAKKAKDVASMAFIHMDQATVENVVFPHVVKAVEVNTEGKEGQNDVPKGRLSLAKFLECMVLSQAETSTH